MDKRKIASLSGGALLAVTATAGVQAATMGPAAAAHGMFHYAPDDGYDPAIAVACGFGSTTIQVNLSEGEGTPGWCEGVEKIYVNNGTEIWCKSGTSGSYVWRKEFDEPDGQWVNEGTAAGGTWQGYPGCTYRLD
jgi:hypothetical protein